MKYVIDIDGTLCTDTGGDYSIAEPYLDRVKYVNELYDRGNRIIIYTARGMGRSNDDVAKATAEFEDLTRNQLQVWGVRYHRLVMGKPSADQYIDNKGTNANDFFIP